MPIFPLIEEEKTNLWNVKIKPHFLLTALWAVVFFSVFGFTTDEEDNYTKKVKVALRDAGSTLLLSDNDSTSLVLPVFELDRNTFLLSFENDLSIVPDSLVHILGRSLERANMSKDYLVEVIRCTDSALVYSYQISRNEAHSIIPCLGRNLPSDCYKVKVLFESEKTIWKTYDKFVLGSLFSTGFIGLWLLFSGKTRKDKHSNQSFSCTTIGDFKFFPEQNRLERNGFAFTLTSKECEVLDVLSKNQNQIVKRDFLIKEIWEDKGVFVGRSLDMFISKIRKKLQADSSIKIVNVHGVGYKLEVD